MWGKMREKRGGADVYVGLLDSLGVVSPLQNRDVDSSFGIAVSILASECRGLDERTSDSILDLCSRQLNRSTLDRLTPRVLEVSS